jgi:hypothetical protein
MELQQFSDLVILELKEMKKSGLRVHKKAIQMAQDLEFVSKYKNMKTSECADWLVTIASLK